MIHLGIDFGTANTRVSKLGDSMVPTVLNIGRTQNSPEMMPSACWIDSDGKVAVGERSLGRPDRILFIKRYWQQRAEDQASQPWKDGQRTISGRAYKCSEIVEAVLAEAVARGLDCLTPQERKAGFTANIVCPVGFDREKRFALVNILSGQGAQTVTLGNVIDEPLAAAVLYCRVEEVPPVRRDLLVFDAGAGTVDVAIVRYEESDGVKRATVLAEAGRCTAGSDFDRVMQKLLLNKISGNTQPLNPEQLFRAYSTDIDVGRIAFEDECEQMKIALGRNQTATLTPRRRIPGIASESVQITREEYCIAAKEVLFGITDVVKSALKMARTVIEDFNGIEMVIMAGGTSRLSFVRESVASVVPGAEFLTHDYLDEMLATVRGAGLSKDFADLIVLRPSYETKLRVTLMNGYTETLLLNEAYEAFPVRQFFGGAVPKIIKKQHFSSPIDTVVAHFVNPGGANIQVSPDVLDPALFRGCNHIEARLDIHALLSLTSQGISKCVAAPYFTQVGLNPRKPYDIKKMSAPDYYPDDN